MDRSFSETNFEFEDQYIPSGNWYPLTSQDDSNTSFFSENYAPEYNDQKLSYSHMSPIDPRTTSQFTNLDFSRNSESSIKDGDPFSVHCRIPVPADLVPASNYQLWLESSFMCRRNERERQRVRSVNDGFSRLRNHLPRNAQIKRRQSKVDTLKHAINYIKQLQTLLDNKSKTENSHINK
ncbi:BHLH domain-containing protein [Caerostris darwini]|uniref:BHLH domain-containing protein n=1 Tax=Caerostris darwini TaxID=1538125 RepID=A0AAV4VGT5_9ARAC|nr:BHLH domain-containing protein [Caerostris darwini]